MELQVLLQTMVNRRASDLHLRTGGPAYLRIDGNLEPAAPQAFSSRGIMDRPSVAIPSPVSPL